jgi:hypothetical protein
MKINEIITEATVAGKLGTALGKTVGGVAKGVGAVAGGVAGIPGAVKQGFQAGKSTVSGQPAQPAQADSVVQQAPGFQGMPVQPKVGAQQYTQDIAAAIRAGAAGDISAKQATQTPFGRAPVNTKIGQWTKTSSGWVNSTNNKAATQIEADTLDKKWYAETQKQARQQATAAKAQPAATTAQTAPSWDPKKKILTKDGLQYKKTTKGWQDIATDELVDTKNAAELQAAFDQASGRVPTQKSTQSTATTSTDGDLFAGDTQQSEFGTQDGQTVVGQVTTPDGIKVVKWTDGIWTIPSTQEEIVKPNDLRQLEILLKQQRPHTGGKRPGVLSPTPGAIKQRQARAAKRQPAVFTSNRPQ